MDWKDLLSTVAIWLEMHPGTASWTQAIGSLAALIAVFLLVFRQNREARSHEKPGLTKRP
jgi:hypothetical protein